MRSSRGAGATHTYECVAPGARRGVSGLACPHGRAGASEPEGGNAWTADAQRPRFALRRRRGAQVLAPQVQGQRPGLARWLVRLLRRVELGAGQEDVAQARVDPVPEV